MEQDVVRQHGAQRIGLDIQQQPMGRPDLQLGELGVDEHHHDPVRRQRARGRIGPARIGADLRLVGEGGLVPMVPIGDVKERDGLELATDEIYGGGVMDGPGAPALDPAILERLVARAAELGFDTGELIYVDHEGQVP